jgi:hypothetical protein
LWHRDANFLKVGIPTAKIMQFGLGLWANTIVEHLSACPALAAGAIRSYLFASKAGKKDIHFYPGLSRFFSGSLSAVVLLSSFIEAERGVEDYGEYRACFRIFIPN